MANTEHDDAVASETPEHDGGASDAPTHIASGVGVVGVDPDLPAPPESEATETVLEETKSSDVDKIAGIVVQTRADVGTESRERIADVLRQRFDDTGISVSDAEVADLADQVATGDA